MSDLDKKIIDIFKDVAIRKSLTKKVGLTDRALPSFIIDWLVSRYMDRSTCYSNLHRWRLKEKDYK